MHLSFPCAPIIQLSGVTTKAELDELECMSVLLDYMDQCGCDVPITVCPMWYSPKLPFLYLVALMCLKKGLGSVWGHKPRFWVMLTLLFGFG